MNIKQMLVSAAVAMLLAPVAAAVAGPMRDSALDREGRSIVDARGNCVHTKWESSNGSCVVSVSTIYFDFNKSSIKLSEKAKLDALVHGAHAKHHVGTVDITGYADHIGNGGYNQKLSHRRAEAVKAYLWHHGVKARRVEVKAMGEKDSVTHCSASLTRSEMIACLAPDRRVEVSLSH